MTTRTAQVPKLIVQAEEIGLKEEPRILHAPQHRLGLRVLPGHGHGEQGSSEP
jgi:hypothetical protein